MKIRNILFYFLALTLPFVLLMNAVILFFTPSFLKFEYERSAFPADPYGFSQEERLRYGGDSILYITKGYDDEFMREMRFSDGSPLYNEREISHMSDVKTVFQNARLVLTIIIVIDIITMLLTVKHLDALPGLLRALRCGGYFTLILMALVFTGILVDFDGLFTAFHHLFFKDQTWLFYETDSLIRLYPEKLWVEGFMYVGITALLFAVLIIVIANLSGKHFKK